MTFARRQVRCARPSGERRLAFHHILGMLLWLLFGTSFASATEIIILKSSDIAAYNQTINGFKSALPSGMILSEFDLQGRPGEGTKARTKDPRL